MCNHGYTKQDLALLLSKTPPSADDDVLGRKWLGPIRCRKAVARNDADKIQIDDFISSSIGHESMDRLIIAALVDNGV